MWKIVYTKQAQKDALKISNAGLKPKVTALLNIISDNPYTYPPSFEKLKGDLQGLVSRRINIQHRLIYQIYLNEKIIKIVSMWTHYE